MKITDKRNKTQTRFGLLSVGNVFVDDDGLVLIKTPLANDTGYMNCVNLATGKYRYAMNTEMVSFIKNAELILK